MDPNGARETAAWSSYWEYALVIVGQIITGRTRDILISDARLKYVEVGNIQSFLDINIMIGSMIYVYTLCNPLIISELFYRLSEK